jgi:hypothetical protein
MRLALVVDIEIIDAHEFSPARCWSLAVSCAELRTKTCLENRLRPLFFDMDSLLIDTETASPKLCPGACTSCPTCMRR